MGSKQIVFIPAVLIIMLAIVGYGLSKRKDMPVQEVLPRDGGVAVVNPMKWYNDLLQISIKNEKGNTIKKRYNDLGECIFQDLVNGEQYVAEVRRTDIKGRLLYRKQQVKVVPRKGGSKYIVLVGASIGKDWNFNQIGERLRLEDGLYFGTRTVYDFDKSKSIETLCGLNTPVRAVIIKECSAYFPRDLSESRDRIVSWVSQLENRGIKPVLATVVPVTKARDEKSQGKLRSIIEYNDFIRSFAQSKGIAVLDLEKGLRISEHDRHLKEEYAESDGSHLVKKAYDEVLDRIFMAIVQGLMNA